MKALVSAWNLSVQDKCPLDYPTLQLVIPAPRHVAAFEIPLVREHAKAGTNEKPLAVGGRGGAFGLSLDGGGNSSRRKKKVDSDSD